MSRVYFDNAATTPIAKEVIDAMVKVMELDFGNPSSVHAPGRKARTIIEESRKSVAKALNCSPGEIFFTSCGTEADNMGIRKSVDCCGIKNIITSAIEHHAVLHTVEELEKSGRIKMHLVNLLENGHVDLNHLEELLQQNSNVLISLMHANNEIGNMLDLEKVSELAEKYKALFHCDTVQTIGHYDFDLSKLNIHFLAGSAHKFNGPKGIGFIYINHKTKITPYITGGSQERNMRAGTENIYGIAGLSKALEMATQNLENEIKHIQEIKTYMIDQLKEKMNGVDFNGDTEGNSLCTVLNVSFPPSSINEMILFKLDIAGISASGGSACTSGSNAGSHVMKAIKANPERAAVRFSFGKYNTKAEVDFVVIKLIEMFQVKKSVEA